VLKFRVQLESAPRMALRLIGSPAGQQGDPALKPEERFTKLFDELRIPLSWYLRRIGLSQEDAAQRRR
jgi:hypothetical protein